MKTLSTLFLSIVFAFITSLGIQAQIISAKEFMELKKADKNMVLVDANKADVYAKAHVQNAVSIPHTALYQDSEIEGLIKSPEELAAYFGENGVSNANNIVVYDDGSNKYSSRVYWILKYLGAENVQILHKDMNEFKKARIPLTRTKTATKATTFTANVNKAVITDMAFVQSGLADGSILLFDSRDPEEYDGSSDKSEGHLKGAKHFNYIDVLTESGAFKSKEELEALASAHGITKDKTAVFYCVTSIRATVQFVAFHEILGYPNIKVYDGAYNEWVANKLPIE